MNCRFAPCWAFSSIRPAAGARWKMTSWLSCHRRWRADPVRWLGHSVRPLDDGTAKAEFSSQGLEAPGKRRPPSGREAGVRVRWVQLPGTEAPRDIRAPLTGEAEGLESCAVFGATRNGMM